jgi:hypothetical protein
MYYTIEKWTEMTKQQQADDKTEIINQTSIQSIYSEIVIVPFSDTERQGKPLKSHVSCYVLVHA